MKKIRFFFLSLCVFCMPVFAFAAEADLNFEEFFQTYFNALIQTAELPVSYQYIQLKYTNVYPGTKLYKTLQKAVYLDVFPNARIELPLDKKITQKQAMSIIRQGFAFASTGDENKLVTVSWLRSVLLDLQNKQSTKTQSGVSPSSQKVNPFQNSFILDDVYSRLQDKFIYTGTLDDKTLFYGGIRGMVESLGDQYTAFFPPTEAQQFNDQLEGEYYGVGAYIQMNKPGELIIVSPIKNSPAEKAGLQAGDRILQVGDNPITSDVSLEKATSWIKGPEGTKVTLKILRNGTTLTLSVERKKIVLENVQLTVYNSGTTASACYISISMFSLYVDREFADVMEKAIKQSCSSYIFDVRNNPGGGLDEVAHMLSYFVPTGKPVVTIKSKSLSEDMFATDVSTAKFINKKVRVLINKGSASASEIFAGTIKDYVKDVLLIGENSFGKGSVQELLNYGDGSMFKYTVAKWYTGKSQKNIDKIGIAPDVVIKDLSGTKLDEVLEYALIH